MKKTLYSLLMLSGIAALSFVSSCKKSEDISSSDTETSIEIAQVDETITDEFSELFLITAQDVSLFDAPVTNGSGKTTNGFDSPIAVNTACKTVTVSPSGNVWPKTVTIDYGTGCDEGGKVKKGKINAVFSGRFRQTGSSINISFDNFYINGDKIEGTKSAVNNGPNADGNYTFTLTINHRRIHAAGGTSTLTAVKTITWVENSNTSPTDDEFRMSGSASATDSKGRTISHNTLAPLVKKVACPYIVSGKLQIEITGRPQIMLDFGAGDCDNKATISANGRSKEITLRK